MNSKAILAVALLAAGTGLSAFIGGCQSPPKPGPMPTNIQSRIDAAIYPALRNTIGEYAAFIDAAPIRVEGYGLVGPLANTGSRVMDPRIRDILNDRFTRAGIGLWSTNTQNIDPDKILDSNQAAAVEVRGIIPPLARKGSTFDLYVNALPDSDATSLENGLLLFVDLKVIGLTLNGNDSARIALGRGPVFIPQPLEAAQEGASYKPPVDAALALRKGRVLGGGVVADDRPARLQLYERNRMRTRMIEQVVNAHFPNTDKIADAIDDSVVNLRVPQEYAGDPMAFIDFVRHLYLTSSEPGFVEKQAKLLIDGLKNPKAPHRDIALALQGLGQPILDAYIRPNYTSADPELRYWCAKAGACMEDSDTDGMTILQEIVKDPGNPFRRQAITAMIEASRGRDTTRATLALMDMIRSVNTDDRILAYHALLSMGSHAVLSYSVGRKFVVDLVPADSPPLIYVLESQSPRIAFIGRIPSLPPGAVYISKDNHFTVSADDGQADATPPGSARVLTADSLGDSPDAARAENSIDSPGAPSDKSEVTLLWRPPLQENLVQLRTIRRLPDLIARATWVPDPADPHYDPKQPYIGASYQRITEMLASMCADGTLGAKFITQQAPAQILSPTDIALAGRPEGSTLSPATRRASAAPAATQESNPEDEPSVDPMHIPEITPPHPNMILPDGP